tara:strand:+ start:1604 stop:1960 length:357 start_codon:yes stop_codon:yes gene_type:complete
MNEVTLFFICILCIEIFIKSNFLSHIKSMIVLINKIIHVLSNKKISDHWKEKVIFSYSLSLSILSLKVLLISSLIISIFTITNIYVNDFLKFTFSFIGIIESVFFAYMYIFLKKIFSK